MPTRILACPRCAENGIILVLLFSFHLLALLDASKQVQEQNRNARNKMAGPKGFSQDNKTHARHNTLNIIKTLIIIKI